MRYYGSSMLMESIESPVYLLNVPLTCRKLMQLNGTALWGFTSSECPLSASCLIDSLQCTLIANSNNTQLCPVDSFTSIKCQQYSLTNALLPPSEKCTLVSNNGYTKDDVYTVAMNERYASAGWRVQRTIQYCQLKQSQYRINLPPLGMRQPLLWGVVDISSRDPRAIVQTVMVSNIINWTLHGLRVLALVVGLCSKSMRRPWVVALTLSSPIWPLLFCFSFYRTLVSVSLQVTQSLLILNSNIMHRGLE